jgi:hypothetical protein
MNPENHKKLQNRVVAAAENALTHQGYVSAIDVLVGIGWLDSWNLKRWQQAQLPFLESGIQTNLSRISEAMGLFRLWAEEKGLSPSETTYVAKAPGRRPLRFSKSGDATIERLYRTHWVSPHLSEEKRARINEKVSRPPELVAIQPLEAGWTCHRCEGTGDYLIKEESGPAVIGELNPSRSDSAGRDPAWPGREGAEPTAVA